MSSFKCLLVGDSQVGKTSLAKRRVCGEFREEYLPTVGAEVYPVKCVSITLNVWDIAGRDDLAGLRDGYYIGADCAIIMFDISNRNSFAHVDNWYASIRRVCGEIPIVICANKVDLHRNVQVKSKEAGRLWGNQPNCLFTEISVKSMFRVDYIFEWLASNV